MTEARLVPAPLPPDEAERLAALSSLDILDTPPEERFDRITRLAKLSLGVPVAIIGLIDAERQWYKSCVGLPATETDRSVTFCSHAILQPDLMEVPDATQDPRFARHPLVIGEPGLRFYAGVPLFARNQPVGTLCIADFRPREMDDDSRTILRTLASLAEHELETHELTRLTNALAESETTVRQILESVMDAVFTFGADLRVQSANPAATQLFAGDPATHAVEDLLTPPAEGWAARIERVPLAPVEAERHEGRRLDGSTFTVELSVGEVSRSESPLFIAVARDVSARHELDLAKERFASTVSHELRTPLTAIRGALEILAEEDTGGTLSPTQERMAGIARRSAERLGRLVEDVLSLERIRQGRLQLQAVPTQLAGVLEESAEAARAMATEGDVEVVIHPTDLSAIGDPDGLVQVFTNLISNAVKFSPGSSQVVVKAEESGEAEVEIRVTDQGRGIPAEALERIFEPFEQAEAGDTRNHGGTGLGLAISRRIVDQLGGSIAAESTYGEGATFTVRLRRA